MTWKVIGTKDGKAATWKIDATSLEEVRRKAEKAGIVIAQIAAAFPSQAAAATPIETADYESEIRAPAPAGPRTGNHGEMDVWSGKPSQWLGLLTYITAAVLTLVAFGVVPFLGAAAVLPFAGFALLMGFIVLGQYLSIRFTEYRLTSERMFFTRGVLARQTIEIELFRIRDFSVNQGLLDRIVGIGTVNAISSDHQAKVMRVAGICDPYGVKEKLRRYVMVTRKQTGTRDLDMAVMDNIGSSML